MLRTFVLPVNRQNPPALPVVEELKAVNAAHERRGIIRIVTRFVRAPHLSNPAKLLNSARYLLFVKGSSLKKWLYARDVTFDIQYLRLKIDIVSSGNARGRN